MTNNETSLSVVESAVADCEVVISRLDHIIQRIEANKAGIQRLVEFEKDIRNDTGADAKKRVSSLATNTAHLDLMRSDLAILERQADSQRKRVIETGKIALSKLMSVWSAIHLHCRHIAEQEIRLSFDVGRLLMPIDHLVGCRLDVLMSKQVQDRLFSIQYADPNGLMEELRRVRERFNQATAAVADEPGLVLNLGSPRTEEPAAIEPIEAEELALV